MTREGLAQTGVPSENKRQRRGRERAEGRFEDQFSLAASLTEREQLARRASAR